MRGNFIYLVVILNFILQSTIFQYFRIFSVIPNTALILIVIISILYGREKGIISGIIAGLLQDIFFSKAIGINLVIYFLIAFSIGGFKKKLFKDNFLTPALLIFVSTLFYHIFYFVIMYFLREPFNLILLFEEVVYKEILLNIVVGLIIYRKVFEYLYSRRLR